MNYENLLKPPTVSTLTQIYFYLFIVLSSSCSVSIYLNIPAIVQLGLITVVIVVRAVPFP